MNDILLYLSLKYEGEWDAILNCLKSQESLNTKDLQARLDEVNNKFNFISLVDENYPENLKDVIKPPFSLFYIGNFDLLFKSSITILGKMTPDNKKYVDYFANNRWSLLWVNLSSKQTMEVLNSYPTGNIFHLSQLDVSTNIQLFRIVLDRPIKENNIFLSEVWQQNPELEYSKQEVRMYLGLTHCVLLLEQPKKSMIALLKSVLLKDHLMILIPDYLNLDVLQKALPKAKVVTFRSNEDINNIFYKA